MIAWEEINYKILSTIKNILLKGSPSFSESEIVAGLSLFKKIILAKTNKPELDGLSKVLIPALQNGLIDDKGNISSLRLLADSLEPFFKKLLILGKGETFDKIKEITLVPAIKLLKLNNDLSNQKKSSGYPQLNESNLNDYENKTQYLYQICKSFIIRNKVHASPDFNDLEVLTYFSDLLVVYLYSTLLYTSEIEKVKIHAIKSDISDNVLNGNDNKILFDFISFGNSTTEIKTQIIDAFILHNLINTEGIEKDTLKNSLEDYLQIELTDHFFIRTLEVLQANQKLKIIKGLKDKIELTDKEENRLCKVQNLFNDNKELFLLYFKDIIDKYDISRHFDAVLEKLKEFFVVNFNIDIKEIYDGEKDFTQDKILDNFLSFLKTILDEEKAKSLIGDLLKLCEESDFIVRISASQVIGRLTNPVYFENYVRKQKRIVYLDTQLILHALCTGYSKNSSYGNIYFKIVDELVRLNKDHSNIELKCSKYYLNEVSYQLKMALLLIPFEGITTQKLSTNIFYEFYEYLNDEDLLNENHSSFSLFLENWLLVTEDDALDRDCERIIASNISDLLTDELDIKIVKLPFYENKESASTLLKEIIEDRNNSLSSKSHYTMSNDALMVCHLFNSDEHTDEPFFLTWDKSFTPFRKAFKKKFKRQDLISWHLFNPSKFLNHMALLEFKIEPKSITNDYLPILDSLGLQEKTRTIYDSMNRLMDIKNISKTQRRKYVQLAQEVFSDNEFGYEINQPLDLHINPSIPFDSIIDSINIHYHSDTQYGLDLYRKMMLNEDFFKQLLSIIKLEIFKKEHQKSEYISQIDELLQLFRDDK